MRTVDLAGTPLRELNAALHRLAPDTNETAWRILNPRGGHAIAVGLDAPIRVEIDGHVGYYCAGMNKAATVVVNGKTKLRLPAAAKGSDAASSGKGAVLPQCSGGSEIKTHRADEGALSFIPSH